MPDLSERKRLDTILPALVTARLSGGSRLWRLCLPKDTVRARSRDARRPSGASSPRVETSSKIRHFDCQIGHISWVYRRFSETVVTKKRFNQKKMDSDVSSHLPHALDDITRGENKTNGAVSNAKTVRRVITPPCGATQSLYING